MNRDTDNCPKTKVNLWCESEITDTMYVFAPKKEIENALQETRHLIDIWLGDEEGEIPDNYDWCACDEDFYVETLQSQFEVEFEDYDNELDFDY